MGLFPATSRLQSNVLYILENLLHSQPSTFALDVAALASRPEYLNLDRWLADNFTVHGAAFLLSMINFLEVKMESEKVSRMSGLAVDGRTMPVSLQNYSHLPPHPSK